MASNQSAAAGSQRTAQVVGYAFAQQFYHILLSSPELVYQFYQESSKLSRPDLSGVMESVSTMEAINGKILAMDYSKLKAEIKTVDSQESLGGVIVLVAGYLTGKDLVKKNFMQSFFLAPQDNGFYVLNDIFRVSSMSSDQSAATGSQPTAEVVGSVFVQQFYHVLHTTPERMYRFYQESSKLSRPDLSGVMETVRTMEAINEKILAVDYSKLKAEINTIDSQESLEGGVVVVVTGYLTGKDLVKKNFLQSFFLAPQDNGFYVLNDIFRYVDEEYQQSEKVDLPNENAESVASEQDPSPPQEEIKQKHTPSPSLEEEEENVEDVYSPPQEEVDRAIIMEEVPVKAVIDEIPPVSQVAVAEPSSVTTINEDAPKKTYAIASALKKMVEDKIARDGVIGIGIAATAVGLVVGGIAAAVARKK